MALDEKSSSVPAPQRKQLKDGMEHLRGFVTLPAASQPQDALPATSLGEEDSYGVPSSIAPIRKPRTDSADNPEKRSDPFQFGSRFLEDGDDIFAHNAWDHVETDDAYKSFAEECYQKQRDAPVSEFDRSTYVLAYQVI